MKSSLREQRGVKYWDVIHWNATSFLSLHDGLNSRLYYDRAARSLTQDLAGALRFVTGELIRSIVGFMFSAGRRRRAGPRPHTPYVLLFTSGGPKYASEEREIADACRKKNLDVKVMSSAPSTASCAEPLSQSSLLVPRDHLWALLMWFGALLRGMPCLGSRDRKRRNLFVAVIPAVREYYLNAALAGRIVADAGAPRFVLSLLPSSPVSVAIVEYMKGMGVLTAGIRTQTTSRNIEHLVSNTDILFYKSRHEKAAYEEVLGGKGPRLEPGCLLSLPEAPPSPPLSLPERYVLLLGTAPSVNINEEEYRRFNDRLFRVGAVSGLPIVFKGHNLAKEEDDAWFASQSLNESRVQRVYDVQRNRELIQRASLIVTAPSTLLYYTILCGKPLIVVESKIASVIPDEFRTAPTIRIGWEQTVEMDWLDWNAMQNSCLAVRSWFEENYYPQNGADYIVGFLLKEADGVPGPSLPEGYTEPLSGSRATDGRDGELIVRLGQYKDHTMLQNLPERIMQRMFQHWPYLYRNGLLQRVFWNLQAKSIDDRWGQGKWDWDVIAGAIAKVRATRILEVGCGGGRLFPLYLRLGIREIVGQDISPEAIRMAARRFRGRGICLTQSPIPQMDYVAGHFDLAVSNRVLQHIPPEQIDQTVASLCRLCRSMYINELSETDALPQTPVMHIHDYERLFANHGLKTIESGMMKKQTWLLFAKCGEGFHEPKNAK